jgi:hypothetical protein
MSATATNDVTPADQLRALFNLTPPVGPRSVFDIDRATLLLLV